MNVSGLQSDKSKRIDVMNWVRKNNIDLMVMQETHSGLQDENKWVREWGYRGYFTNFGTQSRGVGILINNTFEYELHNVVKDAEGRFLILNLTISNIKLTIAGIYGPNADTPDFFAEIQKQVELIGNTSMIIVGDYNVVQNYNLDTHGEKHQNNPKAQSKVEEICQELDLFDIWRNKNPRKKCYTWHSKSRPLKQSRLDYFLVSGDIGDMCENEEINPGYRTDHSLITIGISFSSQTRGRGLWRFNNSMLRDTEYVNKVKICIHETLNQYQNPVTEEFTINDQMLFEMLKLQIRTITMPYCAGKKREREEREKQLENELSQLKSELDENGGMERQQEYERKQDELIVLRKNKIEGIIIRSKARWYLEGEKNSRYFCNLEKHHYTEKLMPKIILEDNTEIEDQNEIINEQKNSMKNSMQAGTHL